MSTHSRFSLTLVLLEVLRGDTPCARSPMDCKTHPGQLCVEVLAGGGLGREGHWCAWVAGHGEGGYRVS